MRLNRHDTWLNFCEKYSVLLTETGLSRTVTHSEYRFRELLETARVEVSCSQDSLAAINQSEWTALYKFVAVFFREFESFVPEDLFPAFRDEVQRRGNRFPNSSSLKFGRA